MKDRFCARRSLHIGIDARPLSYRLTGIGYYVKHLLDAMQAMDCHHRFYLLSNTSIPYEITNARWRKVTGTMDRKLTSTLWMQTCAPLAARRLELDVFWSPRHHLPLLVPDATACVVTIHDIVHRLYPETMSRANLAVERLLMRASIRRATAILTDASSTRQDLQRWYHIRSSKITVIPPGVPPLPMETAAEEAFAQGFPKRFVLFVGTLDPRKNFEGLFSAFERLDPGQHALSLVIVGGRGWKNRAFFEKMERSPVRKHVCLTGYLSRRQLATLYRRALCLVLPSIYEGFGFPILEAMAAGTPVITSTVSSMPEVAGDAAVLVDPEDTEGLSRAILQVAGDRELRRYLIAAGKRRVKRFSWSQCARKTLQVIERTATH